MAIQHAWPPGPPAPDHTVEFVLLSVDVIGHSALFKGKWTDQDSVTNAEALDDLERLVDRRVLTPKAEALSPSHWERRAASDTPDGGASNDKEARRKLKHVKWDWAGDGGIYGFRSTEPRAKVLAHVVGLARRLLMDIESAAPKDSRRRPLRARIVITKGPVFYSKRPENRHGEALNQAGKLKVDSDSNSLTITKDVRDALDPRERIDFVPVSVSGSDEGTLFGLADAIASAHRESTTGHLRAGNFIFAAHAQQALAAHHLSGGSQHHALDALKEAQRWAAEQGRPERFYARTLRFRLHWWERLLESVPGSPRVSVGDSADALTAAGEKQRILHDPLACTALQDAPPWTRAMLVGIERVFAQLSIMSRAFADVPSGLSSLQVSRLLLRAGVPPGRGVNGRLDRVIADMVPEDRESIDGKCSHCTGVALSCLALANRSAEQRQGALRWLASLKEARFCHRARKESAATRTQHAMHYAASVLQGLSDCLEPEAKVTADAVLESLFCDSVIGTPQTAPRVVESGHFSEWMAYRNNSEHETCSYILEAVLRVILARHELVAGVGLHSPRSLAMLKAVAAVKRWLRDEIKRVTAATGDEAAGARDLFVLRESVAALCLGVLLGDEESARLLRRSVTVMHRRLSDHEDPAAELVDSNVDRSRRYLDGYLAFWETVLLLREIGRSDEADACVPESC